MSKVCPTCRERYHGDAIFCQSDGETLVIEKPFIQKGRDLLEPPNSLDSPEAPDPCIGLVLLEQFRIEECIGVGGMGSVYRARQTTLERDVAIKILHSELANNEDAVRRFRREAKITTALDHPNVVNVFLFGQLDDGSLYLIMEYLSGNSLLAILRDEGALELNRALHIACQICDGVAEAHGRGIVHRDLKPENIIIVERGRDADFVKVLDFGIARLLWDEQTVNTQSGLIFGTARYISPEGAAGEATDSRSDVYSIGVLVYQLLVGATPFEADSPVSMLMKHINENPADIRTRGAIPDPVAEVIMCTLDKDPAGRYIDAGELAGALRNAASAIGVELLDARYRPSIASGSHSEHPRRSAPSGPRLRVASVVAATNMATETETAESKSSAMETRSSHSMSPTQASNTLANAPDPFGDSLSSLAVTGLPRGRPNSRRRLVASVAFAFVVGAAVVTLATLRQSKPSSQNATQTSSQTQNHQPTEHDETRMATPIAPGIRLIPEAPRVGDPVTLIGVFDEGTEVPEGLVPAFTIRGPQTHATVEPHASPDGKSWLGNFIFSRAGSFSISLTIRDHGRRAELSHTVTVTEEAVHRTDSRHVHVPIPEHPHSAVPTTAGVNRLTPPSTSSNPPADPSNSTESTETENIDWTAPGQVVNGSPDEPNDSNTTTTTTSAGSTATSTQPAGTITPRHPPERHPHRPPPMDTPPPPPPPPWTGPGKSSSGRLL